RQLQLGVLLPSERLRAYKAAHSLTGILGIFGFKAGSEIARKIETILEGDSSLDVDRQLQLQTLLNELDALLRQATYSLEQISELPSMPLLVIVDPQLELVPSLVSQLWKKKFTVKIAPHLDALKTLLTSLDHPSKSTVQTASETTEDEEAETRSVDKGTLPDVVLFNFSFQSATTDEAAQLERLINQLPVLMLLICSACGSLGVRVKASRLGRYPFLHRPTAESVVKGIERLRVSFQDAAVSSANALSPSSSKSAASTHWPIRKILVVDDDANILSALRSRLEPQGFQLTTLSEPVAFWQTLKTTDPDLLLLDISMPKFSGIDLCQAVRQAPVWSHLPIVFFTSHVNSQLQRAAFSAGADDLIEKSSPDSVLLTHLYEQIRRSHFRQAIAAIAEATSASSP
ncbi:MAG: response regulator, partial [Cyanobacteria bacterium J06576_12]